ncbi:MAG: iron-sulfur cluster insertion protein ErpA [Alphaproteobacteria bacterium]|nr:MAG: iron-sulfur cluster insertion protein ErpA [Alphaproteobacteria bacterium]
MPEAQVTVSASAAAQISTILKSEDRQALLRVSVSGGGCSGFQYGFDLVDEKNDDDLIIERDGVRVVIDPVSLPFLEGSEIDYVDSLIGAAFKVHNPNATSSCGCGTSFSI